MNGAAMTLFDRDAVAEALGAVLVARDAVEEIRSVAGDPVTVRNLASPALEAADHAMRLLATVARSA